jgi:ATP-binding cassette subfamily C (CFTR/MRP) protein 4
MCEPLPLEKVETSLQEETISNRAINPLDNASIFSKITFSWMNPLLAVGAKRTLNEEDLPELTNADSAAKLCADLENCWAKEQEMPQPSFFRALVRTSGLRYLGYSLIYIVGGTVRIFQALLLGALIEHIGKKDASVKEGMLMVTGLFLCTTVYGMCHAQYFFLAWREGMRIRIAVLTMMYKKALRLSVRALQSTTVGHVTNIASTDVEKFQMAFVHLNHVWMSPCEGLAAAYFLYRELGVASIAGVGAVLLLIPAQFLFSKYFTVFRERTAACADQRVRATSQMVQGAKLMKMSAWEGPFVDSITKLRSVGNNSFCPSGFYGFVSRT